jgi:hypothetical protein
MSEEDRRELIARQHRALYGDSSTLYANEGSNRSSSQDVRVTTTSAGNRGNSPLAFDPFGTQTQSANNGNDGAVQMPPREQMATKDATAAGATQRSRANSTSSPSSNPTTSFTLYDNAQQSSRTSTSSPGGSPPRQGTKAPTSGGVAPIGTRPSQGQSQSAGGPMNKRSNTPLPSPLSYGFNANDQQSGNGENRAPSGSSNPPSSAVERPTNLGWGGNSGVWGSSKNSLSASVWG